MSATPSSTFFLSPAPTVTFIPQRTPPVQHTQTPEALPLSAALQGGKAWLDNKCMIVPPPKKIKELFDSFPGATTTSKPHLVCSSVHTTRNPLLGQGRHHFCR
jgi:hypothetical protein